MTQENPNKNSFEKNEALKITPEKVEQKEISQEEFSEFANNEKVNFKQETTNEIGNLNSANFDEETFEKIKNETGVEEELKAIDREAETEIAKAQSELDHKTKTVNENEPAFYVKEVQQLYIDLANKYIEEENPLKKTMIDYYSDAERLTKELSNVFKGQSEQEIKEKIEQTKQGFENNPTFFVEHYQKIFERTAAFSRTRERETANPLAMDEEYDIGTYKEALELQVRDAVFALQRKGYKTFQSGFREKEGDRRQYIDMYNKKVSLPESFIKSFKEKGFEISLVDDFDRTTIYINPLNEKPVTLDEWKKIWDEFADNIPKAEEENFDNIKRYSLYSEFRKKQDLLKNKK